MSRKHLNKYIKPGDDIRLVERTYCHVYHEQVVEWSGEGVHQDFSYQVRLLDAPVNNELFRTIVDLSDDLVLEAFHQEMTMTDTIGGNCLVMVNAFSEDVNHHKVRGDWFASQGFVMSCEGKVKHHAWLENGNHVLDASNNIHVPLINGVANNNILISSKAAYYEIYRATDVVTMRIKQYEAKVRIVTIDGKRVRLDPILHDYIKLEMRHDKVEPWRIQSRKL